MGSIELGNKSRKGFSIINSMRKLIKRRYFEIKIRHFNQLEINNNLNETLAKFGHTYKEHRHNWAEYGGLEVSRKGAEN